MTGFSWWPRVLSESTYICYKKDNQRSTISIARWFSTDGLSGPLDFQKWMFSQSESDFFLNWQQRLATENIMYMMYMMFSVAKRCCQLQCNGHGQLPKKCPDVDQRSIVQ